MSDKSASRTREAGLRFLMKMLPEDLIKAAPAMIEKHIAQKLRDVLPEPGEAGACYLIAPQPGEKIKIMLVTMDNEGGIRRIVSILETAELFNAIMTCIKDI